MSASKTRRGHVCAVAFCAASCAPRPVAVAPPSHDPPARLLVVTDDHLSLRVNAWLELYAHLGGGDAIRAVAACSDDRCAFAALGPTYEQAFPDFMAHAWDERAAVAWHAMEIAHAAWGPRGEGVLARLRTDLAATTGPVDIVSESPRAGADALLPPLLAAESPCFARDKDDDVQNARITDCLVVRALLAGESPHRARFGERFWTVLVVHSVAAVLTRLEPRHVSVDRRAVAVAEPAMLAFITREWHGGAVSPDLAERYQKARASAPPDSASR